MTTLGLVFKKIESDDTTKCDLFIQTQNRNNHQGMRYGYI